MKRASPAAGRDRVILFLKTPVPGLVKTRLIPRLGPEGAAAFYRAMAEDLLDRLEALEDNQLEICFAPAREILRVRRWLGARRRLVPQRGADLGARMAAAFQAAFRAGSERCVLVGSDVPELSAERVGEAFAKLERNDLVLGPSRDGGYYLVGLRQPRPELFADMPWSKQGVYAETTRRARALGLRVGRLRMLADIDTPADLDRLSRRLRARRGPSAQMPRVAAWLSGIRART